MTATPEFSRKLPVDRVPETGCTEHLTAEPDECAALARRFSIPAVNWVRAEIVVEPWRRGGVRLRGRVEAEIVQQCVVTLEDFTSLLSAPIDRLFAVTAGQRGARPQVVEVDVESDDEPDLIEDGAIDLGEVAAETLALNLDAYPRKPGAQFNAATDTDDDDKSASPFAALARLKTGKPGKN